MSKRRRRLAAILAVATVLAVLGVQLATATSHTVVRGKQTTSGFRWKPKLAEVTQGSRVVWRAVDFNHTVTSYGGGWSKNTAISEGEKTSFRFNNTGTFTYRCMVPGHSSLVDGVCSGMCGKVRVT